MPLTAEPSRSVSSATLVLEAAPAAEGDFNDADVSAPRLGKIHRVRRKLADGEYDDPMLIQTKLDACLDALMSDL